MKFSRFASWGVAFLLALGLNAPVQANSNNQWANISDVGAIRLAIVALAVPVLRPGWTGLHQSAYSLGVAEGVSLGLKSVIHEQCPDNSENNSFYSGHASIAFASATTLNRRYGWEVGLPAYAVAILTASARVTSRKHHWYDAVAGAALSRASGWYFTDKFNNQVLLIPWVTSNGGGVMAFVS